MQIASKCKPARAVRAKNKRDGKNLANIQHDLETEITIIVISKLAPNLWI